MFEPLENSYSIFMLTILVELALAVGQNWASDTDVGTRGKGHEGLLIEACRRVSGAIPGRGRARTVVLAR